MDKKELESTVEELSKWKQQKDKDDAVQKATKGRIMLRCSSVAFAIWTSTIGIGAWAAQHSYAIREGIIAFFRADGKQ